MISREGQREGEVEREGIRWFDFRDKSRKKKNQILRVRKKVIYIFYLVVGNEDFMFFSSYLGFVDIFSSFYYLIFIVNSLLGRGYIIRYDVWLRLIPNHCIRPLGNESDDKRRKVSFLLKRVIQM